MIKTSLQYLLIFVIALSLAMLVKMPLSVVIPPQPLGNVSLHGVSGTIWRGKIARVEIQDPQFNSPHVIQNIQIRLQPWQLLLLRVGARVEFDYLKGHGAGQVQLKWGKKLQVKNLAYNANAADLAARFAMGFVNLEGRVSLFINHLEYVFNQPFSQKISAKLHWQQAQISAPLALSLGNVDGVIQQTEPKNINMELKNQGGAVGVKMRALVADNHRWQLEGSIDSQAQMPANLRSTLNMALGAAQNGSYRINRSGNW